MAEWNQRKRRQRALAELFAAALGEDVEAILQRWKVNPYFLRLQLVAAGINPNTGYRLGAEDPDEPEDARHGIDTTTEPSADDKPVAGVVDAPDEDRRHDPIETMSALARQGITPPTLTRPPDEDEVFENDHSQLVATFARGV
jgi:hypothetical protein